MKDGKPHICVCICAFKRPGLLLRLLEHLGKQKTDGTFSFSIVVADNDVEMSSGGVFSEFVKKSEIETSYVREPRQNIALARNAALRHARGDFIAFIDDDEFPKEDWLKVMLEACESGQVAGVLGPVRPYFEVEPPRWIIDGGFCERPEPPTGKIMGWEESRTGNLLFRQNIIEGIGEVFNPEFGTGGEDKDFFMRMAQRGHVFTWCNEGAVYESVPPERLRRSYLLKRAMLRGKNILKHPAGKARLIAKSFIATPLYFVMLPFTLPFGQHVFMKYCIKFCDHAGRIMELLKLNPIGER